MSLLALQRDMRAWLAIGDEGSAARFAGSARPGLAVYQNNYRAQLVSCLEESFPLTLAWLGGEAFHAAVVDHVENTPPSSWTLDHYGRDFPAMLRRLYPDDPDVTDLATIEWSLGEAFVAPDARRLTADLGAVDWDHANLEFVPSLAFHCLTSNAAAIWSALAAGERPPPAARLPSPAALLVWRGGETCRFRSIDDDERAAITFLARPGTSFGAYCASHGAAPTERIGIWLGQWLMDGLIAGIEPLQSAPIIAAVSIEIDGSSATIHSVKSDGKKFGDHHNCVD